MPFPCFSFSCLSWFLLSVFWAFALFFLFLWFPVLFLLLGLRCVGFSLSLFVPVCCLLFSPSSELGGLKGGGGFGLVVVFCSCLGVLLAWRSLSSFLLPSQVASELELGMGITRTPS